MRVDEAVIKFARVAYRFFDVRAELRKDLYQKLTDLCESEGWDEAEAMLAGLEEQEAGLHAIDVATEKTRAVADAQGIAAGAFGGCRSASGTERSR